MSITVVTTRDYEGVPTSKDIYASAITYKIDSSNLLIFAPQFQLLALYPSGNWLTVLVDDPVRVGTGGADPRTVDTGASDADPGSPEPGSPELGSPELGSSEPGSPELGSSDFSVDDDPGSLPHDDFGTGSSADVVAPHPPAPRRDPNVDAGSRVTVDEPAWRAAMARRSPNLMSVDFRTRPYRMPRPEDRPGSSSETSPQSRLRPVTVRLTPPVGAPPGAEPVDDDATTTTPSSDPRARMRPVQFRVRPFRGGGSRPPTDTPDEP